ncbi:hypothetical protein J1G42_05920 [Cellulomonas sp. zg-ZUI222]|uniref:hypothetical protein n=1 Tax=Cellulomonas wangleii TaxID=2816956 RepID=UPI001A93C81C|nr:hypothetical protein [Cellulomonas wangleii]MBO0920360.1 hypothetical protein [Cellulomonas wangleii]
MEDDRLWFSAHPLASERIRPAVPGEALTLTGSDIAGDVVVLRLAPGLRSRRFVPAGGAR